MNHQPSIPSAWQILNLASVSTIKKGEQLNKLSLTDTGKYPALNGGIYPSGYTDNWNTSENTITISEGGNSCGYVNFNEERFWCGGHCYAIKDIKDDVYNNFLYQLLKFRQNDLMKLRVGTGLPNIQKRSLEEFTLLLPTIPEQKRIAEILSSVDKEIQKTDELISKTEKLKTGLMTELFTKGIGHTKFKKTKIGNLPDEWEVVRGSDITDLITKGASPKWQGFTYQSEGMLFVTSENVRDGILDINEPKFLPIEFHQKLKNSQLRENDILINIVGASIGRSCLYKSSYTNANINQAICLVRVNESVLPSFLIQFLQYQPTIQRLLDSQTGSARQNLSLTDIRQFLFIRPSLLEQHKIVKTLSIVDGKIDLIKSLKQKLIQLKKGLMSDLLSGKVRTVNY